MPSDTHEKTCCIIFLLFWFLYIYTPKSKMNANKMSATSYSTGGEGIEEIKAQIEEEKKDQEEIQKHISDFQKKIIEKRQQLGGHNAGAENESSLAKQIKILENRLDKAN